MDCYRCGGNGDVECSQCHGQGFVNQDTPCPHCHGEGFHICQTCLGNGAID
ncbi:hypothetical protein HUR95_02170 [Caldalkalibacillus thermarum TA2.A1]|uniref:Molecular chaperone DnaJ n=1 Tax=Caldalkalibacillus thermarum (strain TA2.A1) TaxID=986075 RepID=A0A8X8LBN4_CALTT|nr:hypothetical protein [Caldalkalibacillus thermarum]QZT34240.1 hypothetical protein HUR95_02170 [Caldalkalibacillus thermarum TA2.A1]